MSDYRIITDACSDLLPNLVKELDIMVIPMEVTMTDGRVFNHHYDYREMSAKDFYDVIRSGVMASTSQITPQKYIEYFTPVLENGEDLIYIALSGGLSQTYSSSVVAVGELREKYPDRKIYTFDSLAGAGGQGLITVEAARKRKSGSGIDETADWLRENILRMASLWTVDDLFHLKRGGRVKAGAAIIGTALSIKPYGVIEEDGTLPMVGKCRGKKSSLHKLFEMMSRLQSDPEGEAMICHCDAADDANSLKNLILEAYPKKKVYSVNVGPVIGAHLGPGAVTLFFWATGRK